MADLEDLLLDYQASAEDTNFDPDQPLPMLEQPLQATPHVQAIEHVLPLCDPPTADYVQVRVLVSTRLQQCPPNEVTNQMPTCSMIAYHVAFNTLAKSSFRDKLAALAIPHLLQHHPFAQMVQAGISFQLTQPRMGFHRSKKLPYFKTPVHESGPVNDDIRYINSKGKPSVQVLLSFLVEIPKTQTWTPPPTSSLQAPAPAFSLISTTPAFEEMNCYHWLKELYQIAQLPTTFHQMSQYVKLAGKIKASLDALQLPSPPKTGKRNPSTTQAHPKKPTPVHPPSPLPGPSTQPTKVKEDLRTILRNKHPKRLGPSQPRRFTRTVDATPANRHLQQHRRGGKPNQRG